MAPTRPHLTNLPCLRCAACHLVCFHSIGFSSIQYPVSFQCCRSSPSIQHPASSIHHPESSILAVLSELAQHPASRLLAVLSELIQHPASSIFAMLSELTQHPASSFRCMYSIAFRHSTEGPPSIKFILYILDMSHVFPS